MKKIILTIMISLFFSFSLYFLFEAFSDTPNVITTPKRYPILSETNEKKIFLIGSSQVYQINATKINEKLQLTDEEYVVYNFGMHGTFLESFINNHKSESDPKIVLYGISYRDFFVDVENDDNVLDINNLF